MAEGLTELQAAALQEKFPVLVEQIKSVRDQTFQALVALGFIDDIVLPPVASVTSPVIANEYHPDPNEYPPGGPLTQDEVTARAAAEARGVAARIRVDTFVKTIQVLAWTGAL